MNDSGNYIQVYQDHDMN